MRRWPGVLLVLMSVMLVGAACSKSNSGGSTTPGATTAPTTGATTAPTTGATTAPTTGATTAPTTGATTAPTTGATTAPTTAPSGSGEGSGGGQVTIDGEQANDHGSADLSGKSTFKVETDNYYFDPTTLKGTAGEKVTLTFSNESSTNHNFTVESQHINLDVDAGQTKTVTVTFPKSGSVEFHCEYHQSLGMVGQLTTS
jgi:plastocyanin